MEKEHLPRRAIALAIWYNFYKKIMKGYIATALYIDSHGSIPSKPDVIGKRQNDEKNFD